jgi:heat shock protein HslJ
MSKSFKIIVSVVVALGAVMVLAMLLAGPPSGWFSNPPRVATTTPQGATLSINAKNATYSIGGAMVKLVNGVSVVDAVPGSATKITTRYFGNEVAPDFNGDGRPDIAFIMTQDTGGSGVFYYAVAALNTSSGFVGSQGFLLGDRIAPQATSMGSGTIVIFNYGDRKPGDSFAVPPSMGKSTWLKLDTSTMQFGEVVQNFEGEADPSRMTLNMKTWNWIDTIYANGTKITPRLANKFTLTFSGTNTFSAATDCNGVGGEYTASGTSISFTKMMSTLMYCQNSQEADYAKMFSEVKSYHFTSKGELIFDLSFDSGSFIFQ